MCVCGGGKRLRPPSQEPDSPNLGLYPAQGAQQVVAVFSGVQSRPCLASCQAKRGAFRGAARISGDPDPEERTVAMGVELEEGVWGLLAIPSFGKGTTY